MANDFCPKCGQATQPQDRFCAKCGAPVGKEQADSPASEGKTWKRDVTLIVGLVVVVVVGYLVMHKSAEQPQPRESRMETPIGHEGMDAAILQNMPTEYNDLVQAGNQYMDQENFPVAAELYRRALAIDPGSADVRTDFGACLHGMGLPARAIEEFHRVIEEHPEHQIANFNLGIVYYGTGQFDSARYYWEEFLASEPVGTPAELAREYLKKLEN